MYRGNNRMHCGNSEIEELESEGNRFRSGQREWQFRSSVFDTLNSKCLLGVEVAMSSRLLDNSQVLC